MIFRNLKSPSSDSFIDLISSIPDGCTEPLTIYLDQPYDTFDGFVFEFIDFFNSYKGEVTLVATGNLTNSTALFFLCSNTKKVISPVSSLELSNIKPSEIPPYLFHWLSKETNIASPIVF